VTEEDSEDVWLWQPYLSPIIARHVTAPGDFKPGIALLVTAVWTASAVAAGPFLITRRDA
jgi:hypothetical protein